MRPRTAESGALLIATTVALTLLGLPPAHGASSSAARRAISPSSCPSLASASAVVRRTQLAGSAGVQQPASLAVDATRGRLYVAAEATNAMAAAIISEIDICTGVTLAQRHLHGYAGHIAVDPRANMLAVILPGDTNTTLWLLNATTLALLHTIVLPGTGDPQLIIDSADGRVAASNGARGLVLLDVRTGRLVRRLLLRYLINGAPFYSSLVGIASDERRHQLAFISMDDGGGIIDAVTGAILHRFLLYDQPQGIAMDPVRGETVTIYSGDVTHPNRIAFLDTQSGRLLQRSVLPGDPTGLAIDLSTRHIFVPVRLPNDDQGLAMIDARTRTPRRAVTLARTNGSYIHFGAGEMAIDALRHHLFLGVDGPTSWSTGKYSGPGRLFTIDTRTGAIIAARRVGSAPDLIALDVPANRIVLGDTDNNSLTYLVPSRLSAATTPPTIVTGPAPPLCHPYTAQTQFVDRGQLHPLVSGHGRPRAPQPTGPYLGSIARGPDRALWFATTTKGVIGRITTAGRISLYTLPPAITEVGWLMAGPHGALWFTMSHGIGYIDGQHHVLTVLLPRSDHSQLRALTLGADGRVWFDETGSGPGDRVGRVSLRGAAQAFCLPGRQPAPVGLATGPDGNVWVAQSGKDSIARVTPRGHISEFPLGSVDGSQPGFIAHYVEYIASARGALWFTEFARRLGRITTTGHVTIVHLPQSPFNQGVPFIITPGPGGALWFSEIYGNAVGRISSRGVITEFSLPTPNAGPLGITAGPDGALWVTEMCTNAIARVTPAGHVIEYPVSTTRHGNGAYCVESP